MYETALADDELITAVSFPVPKKAGYAKFPNPASRFALVGVFVAQTGGGVRVAVTGAASSVFRSKPPRGCAREELHGSGREGRQGRVQRPQPGSARLPEYRAHLMPVLAARAVAAAG